MSYENWKVLKSVINYSGVDEEKQKEAELAREEYANVAAWCNETQQYSIEEVGDYYEVVAIPEPTIKELNEQIRQQRQVRYVAESDPIRLEYDEALAREQDNAEELKQEWLASKDKIREELPYVVGEE